VRFRPEQSLKQKQLHRQRFATMQLQARLTKADLVGDLAEDATLTSDRVEFSDLEDYGDSEVFFQGTDVETSFDRERLLTLPLVSQLPRRARPILHFRLDENLELHSVGGEDRAGGLRFLVASAIAEHIRQSAIKLLQRDDWCQLPAIEGDNGLAELVPNPQDRTRLSAALAKVGSDLKSFAIMLPNGDVITPQTLMNQAREGKRATRAAVLRLRAKRPDRIADETWTANDWKVFDQTQRKKRLSYSKTSSAPKAKSHTSSQ
jgi:hypothetical protein